MKRQRKEHLCQFNSVTRLCVICGAPFVPPKAETPGTSTASVPTGQTAQQRDQAHRLAMLALQSDRYVADADFANATDAVLYWSKLPPVPEQPKSEGAAGALADADFLTQTLVSALDNKYSALRASHDELLSALGSINKVTSPGSRTLDEFMSDMGYACDRSRLAIKKAEALKKDQNLEKPNTTRPQPFSDRWRLNI